jgi:hypothetical protein
MLLAAILGAQLRAGAVGVALIVAGVVFATAVALASRLHRRVRSREAAQLVATGCLGLAGAPIEWAAGVPARDIVAGTAARVAIFVSSSLLVRAAFARSARNPGLSSRAWQLAAVLLLGATCTLLALAEQLVEARACAMAAAVCGLVARWNPTAKQLKPLGLGLAGLALGSAVALAL